MVMPHSAIADKIVNIWNVPKNDRDRAHQRLSCVRNPALTPEDVLDRLRRDHNSAAIQDGIRAFLSAFSQARLAGQLPTSEEHFAAQCMLDLLISDTTLRIDKQLVSEIVRTFDSILWYRPIGTLVEQHLTDCELLEALLTGLRSDTNEDILLSALNGVRAYHGRARRDRRPGCREELTSRVMNSLEQLRAHQEQAVREQVRSAEKWLRAL